jgi:DNA-binding response OmpR family regulator
MSASSQSKCILLIIDQPTWRETARTALKSSGFVVCTLDSYNQVLLDDCLRDKNPDLIVLGCTFVDSEEQRLIARVLARKYHLLILCASLSRQEMRKQFIQGVDDIVDKPYDAASLVKIVDQVMESTVPRNSYQAVERYGVA